MRDGVGELFFRAMRAWASALEGHDDDSLRDLMRCGDIVIQHPGFCRTSTWYVDFEGGFPGTLNA
ncbi:unnamed protein product [Ascophyllum nodosum]